MGAEASGTRGGSGKESGPEPAPTCMRCGVVCAGKAFVRDELERCLCWTCQTGDTRPLKMDGAIELEIVRGEERVEPCPACARLMGVGATLCTHCGFDLRRGFAPGTGIGASATKSGTLTCNHCGYDMRGLKTTKCPECGKRVTPPSRSAEREQAARKMTRREGMTAAGMIVVGLAGTSLVVFVQGWSQVGLDEGVTRCLGYLVSYAVQAPPGVVAVFVSMAMLIGFNAPAWLVTLRMAGIYAVCDLVQVLLGLTAIPPLIGWMLACGVYIGMLIEIMEMEPAEAVIVFFVTGGVRLVVAMAIHFVLSTGLPRLLGSP